MKYDWHVTEETKKDIHVAIDFCKKEIERVRLSILKMDGYGNIIFFTPSLSRGARQWE